MRETGDSTLYKIYYYCNLGLGAWLSASFHSSCAMEIASFCLLCFSVASSSVQVLRPPDLVLHLPDADDDETCSSRRQSRITALLLLPPPAPGECECEFILFFSTSPRARNNIYDSTTRFVSRRILNCNFLMIEKLWIWMLLCSTKTQLQRFSRLDN